MEKTYRKIIGGIVVIGIILGVTGLFLKYGVFQGIQSNKTERSNQECIIEKRVFDEAGKLTGREEKKLEALIAKKEKIMGADLVLLTIKDDSLDSYEKIREYAQNYYEIHCFGWNQANGDGIIYVDDWATGYTWLCTTGKVADKLDRKDIDYIVKRTNRRVNRNPYRAYRFMVNSVVSQMQSENIFHLDISPFWLLLISAIVAFIFAGTQIAGHGGRDTVTKSTYTGKNGVKMNETHDLYLRSFVTRRKIEKKEDSNLSDIGGSDGHGGGGGRH